MWLWLNCPERALEMNLQFVLVSGSGNPLYTGIEINSISAEGNGNIARLRTH
jgi:hypothetical protein